MSHEPTLAPNWVATCDGCLRAYSRWLRFDACRSGLARCRLQTRLAHGPQTILRPRHKTVSQGRHSEYERAKRVAIQVVSTHRALKPALCCLAGLWRSCCSKCVPADVANMWVLTEKIADARTDGGGAGAGSCLRCGVVSLAGPLNAATLRRPPLNQPLPTGIWR